MESGLFSNPTFFNPEAMAPEDTKVTNNHADASKLARKLLSLIIVLFIIVSYWLLAIQTDLRPAVPFLIGVAAGLVGVDPL